MNAIRSLDAARSVGGKLANSLYRLVDQWQLVDWQVRRWSYETPHDDTWTITSPAVEAVVDARLDNA